MDNEKSSLIISTELMKQGRSILKPSLGTIVINHELFEPDDDEEEEEEEVEDEDSSVGIIMDDLEMFKKLNNLKNLEEIKTFKKFLNLNCTHSTFRIKLLKAILAREAETGGFSMKNAELLEFIETSQLRQSLLMIEHLNWNPFMTDESLNNALHLLIIKARKHETDSFDNMMPLFYKILQHPETRQHINDQTDRGHTALHLAYLRRDVDFVKSLIENNADRSLVDKAGKTALDLAKLEDIDRIKILQHYVQKEDDVDILLRALRDSNKFQKTAAAKHVTEIFAKKDDEKCFRDRYYRLLVDGLKKDFSIDEKIFSGDLEKFLLSVDCVVTSPNKKQKKD